MSLAHDLEELSDMREQGVLSDADFAAAKHRLLASEGPGGDLDASVARTEDPGFTSEPLVDDRDEQTGTAGVMAPGRETREGPRRPSRWMVVWTVVVILVATWAWNALSGGDQQETRPSVAQGGGGNDFEAAASGPPVTNGRSDCLDGQQDFMDLPNYDAPATNWLIGSGQGHLDLNKVTLRLDDEYLTATFYPHPDFNPAAALPDRSHESFWNWGLNLPLYVDGGVAYEIHVDAWSDAFDVSLTDGVAADTRFLYSAGPGDSRLRLATGLIVVKVPRDELPNLAESFSWAGYVTSYRAVNSGTWQEYHVWDRCPTVRSAVEFSTDEVVELGVKTQ